MQSSSETLFKSLSSVYPLSLLLQVWDKVAHQGRSLQQTNFLTSCQFGSKECESSHLLSPGVTCWKQCDLRCESGLCPCSTGSSVTFGERTSQASENASVSKVLDRSPQP
ncbi:hypothetical protein STEG23_034226 [Scotinomys teguina]